MSEEIIEFAVDQRVVYPSQGVGHVKEIFEKKVGEESLKYYKIYLEVSDMVVMVPVDNSSQLGIRSIVSADKARKALDMITEDFEPPTSDWKLRYQMNLDLLKSGTIEDIASIVRSLYQRSKVKELPILERKLFDSAKKLLIDEFSEALGISEKETEAMLHAKLEPIGQKIEKKSPVFEDEDEDEDDFGDELDADEKDTSSDDETDGDDDDDDDED